MHIYAAGLLVAGSRVYEDGAQLARGCGVVGTVLVGSSALISKFGRGYHAGSLRAPRVLSHPRLDLLVPGRCRACDDGRRLR